MIMRFRPANISLINRRHYLPRLLLTLSLIKKNDQRTLTGHYISKYVSAANRSEHLSQQKVCCLITNDDFSVT
jgi:hypothetical protein